MQATRLPFTTFLARCQPVLACALVTATLATAALLLPATAAAQVNAKPKATNPVCPALLKHQFPRLQDEAPQDLCQFTGKVVLVVNTASYCGFTGQYEGLEALYAKYQARGLVVLGFPSNDFGRQEPGSAKQIADLCFNTYGVKFPMFSKSSVTGAGSNPLHAALSKASGSSPQWNFHKYLIGRDGRLLTHFAGEVEPLNSRLTQAVEKAL